MTEEETEESEKSEQTGESADPDFVKRDEIPDSPASEEFVKEQMESTVDKTVEQVSEEVGKQLPDGDLATVGYIDEAVDKAVDERLAEKEEEEEEEDEPEETEEKGDDEEEEEEEEPPEPSAEKEGEDKPPAPPEDDDEEEEEGEDEPPKPPAERDKAIDDEARTALKEALPDDVWNVVTEYVGDSKMDESTTEKSAESDIDDELEKQVASILGGDGAESPAIPTGDREDEIDKNYSEEDEADESPALSNFYDDQ